MADESGQGSSQAPLCDEKLRQWLRVPRSCPLPGWAATRLAESVRTVTALRDGRCLEETVFGVVDLETTGISSRMDRILEIGLVVQRAGRVLSRFSTLIDPGIPVPAWIHTLTGIDAQALKGAPDEAQALAAFASTLQKEGVEILVAHNARFDRAFLERAWSAYQLEQTLPRFYCSMLLARKWIRATSYALDALVSQLAIPTHARHRALGDAEMTATLWNELLARGRLQGVHTLECLDELAAVGRTRSQKRPDLHA